MPVQSKRTSATLRQDNVARAARLVHVFHGLSRAQLTARLGVTRSTAKTIVEALTDVGLIREEPQPSTVGRGRPSPALTPAPAGPVVLAVEVAVSHVAVATVGFGTRLTEVIREPLPPTPTPTEVVELIGTLGRDQLRKAQRPVLGAGVSFYGAVREADGFVLHAPSLGWRDLALEGLIAGTLGGRLPVSVGNDADLAAMAEARRLGEAEPQDLVYLIAELGLGAGVVSGGSLLNGANGAFGEVGHMVVNPDGRHCPCGRTGCWETEVDAVALLRHAGRPASQNLRGSVARVVADAQAGDVQARDGLAEYVRWMAIGLTNVVNIFDPPRVLFGGILAQVLPTIGEELTRTVSHNGLVRRGVPLSISASRLGQESALIGAADLAFAGLLSDPLEWAGKD